MLYVANAAKIGGGIKILMDLMLNLDASRFAPALVVPEEGPALEWARSIGVPCEVSRAGDWWGLTGLTRRSIDLARIIRRQRATIVHAAAPPAYRALGIAALATGAMRVCHLGFPPEPGELERAFIAGPDAVIGCYTAQAEENRAAILRIKPHCRVVGVPNGVDVQRFSPGPPSPAARALRGDADAVIAILGHISDVKGYPAFVEAAAAIASQYPRTRFLAIGAETTQPGARAAIEERVRALGLRERFTFLGFRDDVHAVLRAVDIVAVPSLAEGLPLAVLEAMACGKPVIATPVGGVLEAVIPGKTGLLVPPGDSPALTTALRELIESPARRLSLGTAARAWIEERYSIAAFARGVQNVYGQLMAAHSDGLAERAAMSV